MTSPTVPAADLALRELPHPATELAGARESTRVAWRLAVECAVDVMRERLADPLALDAMARTVFLSPYHFHRVFRLVTGIPPGRFLTALRMAEAKRLLLCTSQRVTDICFAVGFESLGTFTTRFGQLVGVAPQQLRRLAEEHGKRSLAGLAEGVADDNSSGGSLSGWLEAESGGSCVALVGLFERPVPQGLPVACDVVAQTPGAFRIGSVAHGNYCPLALGFPGAQTVLEATLVDPRQLLVGALPQPVTLEADDSHADVLLSLDTPASIDPPIVLAAPLLVAETSRVARTP